MSTSAYETFEGAFRDQEASKLATIALLDEFKAKLLNPDCNDFQVGDLAKLAGGLHVIATEFPILDPLDEDGNHYLASNHFNEVFAYASEHVQV
jgi:hypothetical protein